MSILRFLCGFLAMGLLFGGCDSGSNIRSKESVLAKTSSSNGLKDKPEEALACEEEKVVSAEADEVRMKAEFVPVPQFQQLEVEVEFLKEGLLKDKNLRLVLDMETAKKQKLQERYLSTEWEKYLQTAAADAKNANQGAHGVLRFLFPLPKAMLEGVGWRNVTLSLYRKAGCELLMLGFATAGMGGGHP